MDIKKPVYTQEFKAQLIKEVQDTGNQSSVSRRHDVPITTLHGWISNKKHCADRSENKVVKQLKMQLVDAELEIQILKEILKKTNQAWLKK